MAADTLESRARALLTQMSGLPIDGQRPDPPVLRELIAALREERARALEEAAHEGPKRKQWRTYLRERAAKERSNG